MISVGNTNQINKRKLHNWSFSFLGTIAILFLSSCSEASKKKVVNHNLRYEIKGEAQGTTYSILYYSDHTIPKTNIDSILDVIDLAASIWVDSSVISQMNRSQDSLIIIDDATGYFVDNFNLSKEVYQNTNGAYNPTVGMLVNAWGFGFKNKEKMDSIKVDSLLQSVGFNDDQMWMHIDNDQIWMHKTNPNTHLDFNGIAQGYSVDVLADYFLENGISDYMIEVGGELVAHGTKPDGSLWNIGIDIPSDKNMERNLAATVRLDNVAVATSGNYRKFYEVDGVRYAHTLNPKTGFPVQHSLLSATIIMDNCALADAYATAFMVMGFEAAKELVESNPELGINAYFIYSGDQGEMQTYFSAGLENMIKEL
jgi:thiamine biosynthesis lipoprotein